MDTTVTGFLWNLNGLNNNTMPSNIDLLPLVQLELMGYAITVRLTYVSGAKVGENIISSIRIETGNYLPNHQFNNDGLLLI